MTIKLRLSIKTSNQAIFSFLLFLFLEIIQSTKKVLRTNRKVTMTYGIQCTLNYFGARHSNNPTGLPLGMPFKYRNGKLDAILHFHKKDVLTAGIKELIGQPTHLSKECAAKLSWSVKTIVVLRPFSIKYKENTQMQDKKLLKDNEDMDIPITSVPPSALANATMGLDKPLGCIGDEQDSTEGLENPLPEYPGVKVMEIIFLDDQLDQLVAHEPTSTITETVVSSTEREVVAEPTENRETVSSESNQKTETVPATQASEQTPTQPQTETAEAEKE